ncbi:Fatty acid desaturase [seawater metagenome]|uniref:Fatty acid desaturase n=1 Tax=seawater metagenome TaxID=1561972 RepID=A0A5E8CJX7_9ZZZZ
MKKVLWNIYGNKYDLNDFLDNHPGGRHILENVKGDTDLTPLFESYHAFGDFESIKNQLNRYKVDEPGVEQIYNFDKNGFYYTLKKRVREYFGQKKSLTDKIKINNFWVIKTIISICMFIFTYSIAFFSTSIFALRVLNGFLSGILFVVLGFCIMHDASHYALFNKRNQINIYFSQIWNSFALWDYDLWFRHHGHYHHSFTGSDLDPDVKFMKPLIIKSPINSTKGYLIIENKTLLFSISFVWFLIFPGFFLGQGMLYWMVWKKKGYLWNLGLPKLTFSWLKILLGGLFIFSHLYKFNFWVSLSYLIAANISYGCCILPDHDTYQSMINQAKTNDWGEAQVVHSANFETKRFCDYFCYIFGGINYQIEHHLFPSMCHVHYPEIAPIVKKTCQEFNIEYVEHSSVYDSLKDVIKSLIILNKHNKSNKKS